MRQYRDDYDDYEVLDDEADGQLEPVGPMVVVSRGPAALAARRREAGQAARRVPYVATAATGAAGLTALGLVEAAAAAGQPALAGTIAVGTWVATGAGLPVLRLRFRDRAGPGGCTVQRIPRGFRRRWWEAGGAAALWIDAMAAGAVDVVGPGGMAAILLGGAWLLSARWMREHPVELPTDTPTPALPAVEPPPAIEPPPPPVKFPAPPPPDEGDEIAELWDTRVAAGPNAIAPGSELGDDRVDLPHGYQWVVQLDPNGTIGCTRLCGRAEDIALKLGIKTTHVDIDQLPGDDAREDRALLTVITKDVLKNGVPYRGPVYRGDGSIPLGMYADGSGQPHWVARDDTGPQHGMVTGGTGSGKSELLARLGMAYRDSGEWDVLFGDGDETGRSSPLLKRVAYDFTKGDEVLEQLEALEAWAHARGELMGSLTEGPDGTPIPMTDPRREEPVAKVLPCRRFRGRVWILDEFHRLVKMLGRGFVERVEQLARIIRKLGGAIIIGTQSATVGDFGDSDVLRGLMALGNVVIMRTKNKTEQYVVADFGCDPTTLPKGGGYGFVDDGGRKMMFRSEYSKHMARWVSSLPPYRITDELAAAVYASKRPPKPADPVADYKEAQQRIAAIQASLDAGEPLPWEPQPAQPAAQPTPPIAPVGGDGVAAPIPAAPHGPPRWSAGGVGIAEPLLGPMFPEVAAAGPGLPALTSKAVQVLAMLRSRPGSWTTGELEGATRLSKPDASKALGELVRHSLAHRPTGKAGTYQAGTAPAALAQ